jgi:hypothetical protein
MAINFPDAPSDAQTYLDGNGVTWTYVLADDSWKPNETHGHDVLKNVASGVMIGRSSGGMGDSEELVAATARTVMNVDVAVSQVSGAEITAGTETAIRKYAPADIKAFVDKPKVASEPSSDHDWIGETIDFLNATATLSIGDFVYLSATGWALVDADAESTASGMLGICVEAGTTSNPINVLVNGFFRDDTFAFTAGNVLYVSTVAGDVTTTAPTAENDIVRVVGYAVTDDFIRFCPDNSWRVNKLFASTVISDTFAWTTD